MLPGGKGANQACAAGKLAAGRFAVRMTGRTGYDLFADHLKASLAAAGVDVSGVHGCSTESTGTAMIWVEAGSGQNSIVVTPGANSMLSSSDAEASRPVFRGARYALFQLENPLPAVTAMMRIAASEGAHVILDPAPAQCLSHELLEQTAILTPNETEACLLLGRSFHHRRIDPASEAPEMAQALLALGPKTVVLKLGDAGCYFSSQDGESGHLPAFPVDQVVDTTAAGDVFNAGIAVALAEGRPWIESLRFASAAAALSVTRVGAQSSVPSRAEVNEFLLSHPAS
jgi:ribokinase